MNLGYLPRLAEAVLDQAMTTFPMVVVDGPRAVGKTTTARRVATSTLELPRDLDRLAADPSRLLATLEPLVLIDEWQLAGTDLLWPLKRIVDSDPTPGPSISPRTPATTTLRTRGGTPRQR